MKYKFFMVSIYATITLLFIAAIVGIWVDNVIAGKIALTGLSIFGLGYALFLCRLK